MAKVMREVATVTLTHEVRVDDVIRAAMHRHELWTVEELREALAADPYRVRIGRSYLNDIVNGERWPKDDTVLAALLHLLDLELANLGISPDERPAAWMALEYAKANGWRTGNPGKGGNPHTDPGKGPEDGQVNSTIRRKTSLAGQRLAATAGIGACITSTLSGANAA